MHKLDGRSKEIFPYFFDKIKYLWTVLRFSHIVP